MKSKFLLPVILLVFNGLFAQEPILNNPVAEQIGSGFNFIEGPVWVEDLGLLFSDIPENKIYLFDKDSVVSEYLNPSGKSNGLSLDLDSNLILCQHLDRQVGVYRNGTIETLASHYNGKRFNSPNDLAVKSNGVIYFTDPDFGLNDEGLSSELGFKGIYSITPDGKVHLLDESLNLPNGICFSVDEKKLYVVDSQVADVYVWDVVDDTTIINKTLFYNNPGSWGDGMKIDKNGFLYTTASNGLSILTPEGKLFKSVTFSGNGPSNCTWGGSIGEPEMYVTAGKTLWRVKNKIEPTGLNYMKNENPVEIFSNPLNGTVTINLNGLEKDFIKAEILDMNGKKLSIISKSNLIDSYYEPEKMNAGIYLLTINSGARIYSEKFVVF